MKKVFTHFGIYKNSYEKLSKWYIIPENGWFKRFYVFDLFQAILTLQLAHSTVHTYKANKDRKALTKIKMSATKVNRRIENKLKH